MKTRLLLAIALVSSLGLMAQEDQTPEPLQYPFAEPGSSPRGVFGDDDRQEVKDAHGIEDFVRATAVMVPKYNVEGNRLYGYTLRELLGQQFGSNNFDQNVKYLDQPAIANCTGFLIAPDILVTAGHCVTTLEEAQEWVWVFDYTSDIKYNEAGKFIEVPQENIYEVVDVLGAVLDEYEGDTDYAVLQLSRKSDRKPYRFRTSGNVSKFTNVSTIGSPTGLPLKYSDKAYVIENDNAEWFKSNIDAFPGNSGGPVFNPNGFLEGILVRGAVEFANGEYTGDYKFDYSCNCVKTVQFVTAENTAGLQSHKITSIPLDIIYRAVYENLEYAVKNKIQDRFDAWKIYGWMFNHTYAKERGDFENMAIDANNTAALSEILAFTAGSLSSDEGRNLLNKAIDKNDTALLKLLLDNSIYVDAGSSFRYTPLQYAVMENKTEIAKILVERGADVTVKDDYKNNLLHLAAKKKNDALAKLFVGKGVSASAKNSDGKTPEKLAKSAGDKDLFKYLKKERKRK